jgi:hypothetical protein
VTTYFYEEVSAPARRKGNCPVCGKATLRAKRFTQTVNPFNRNADGTVKTRAEVLASVDAQAMAWEPDFTHYACREALS